LIKIKACGLRRYRSAYGLERAASGSSLSNRGRIRHTVVPAPGSLVSVRCPSSRSTTMLVHDVQAETGQCIKRKLMPDDIVPIVLFFAADDSGACTNQNYIVDGGWVQPYGRMR